MNKRGNRTLVDRQYFTATVRPRKSSSKRCRAEKKNNNNKTTGPEGKRHFHVLG